jgi:hypothetical protein
MIDSVETFSDRLNGLDPDDVAFVLHVDELVEQTSPATLEAAYPAIFRFFEAHPENDCGMPGTLVHMMEDYYPNYVDELLESVKRMPSTNTVLTVNRILNSDVEDDLRDRLIDCLRAARTHNDSPSLVRAEAQRYLDHHT